VELTPDRAAVPLPDGPLQGRRGRERAGTGVGGCYEAAEAGCRGTYLARKASIRPVQLGRSSAERNGPRRDEQRQ
jgi:hypothetical protein